MISRIFNKIRTFISLLKKQLNILKNDSQKKEIVSLKDIKIVHYSKNFLVVNKRYDVLINSNNPEDTITVQTQLKEIVPELINPSLGHDFYFSHRLDFATSGILCLPTNKTASKQATQAFSKQIVEKYYIAIVRGIISQEILDIDLGIGIDTRPEFENIRMAVEGSPYVGKTRSAFTRLLVLEKGISYGYPATKVLLKPMTGRRHQLRLHLNALGHTIVGDYTYSNRKDVEPFRMFLHAFRLVMPTSLEHLCVQTEDPFGEDNPLNRWKSYEVVHTLDSNAITLIKEAKNRFVFTTKL